MTVANSALFRSLLENVKNDVDTQSNLSQLKLALTALNSSQLSHLAHGLQMDIIFDCLNSSNREQIHTCSEILSTVLPALPVPQVLSQYGPALNRALNHPEKEVREAVLLELVHATSDPALISKLHNDNSLLKNVISCLCDEELAVANYAIKFLVKLGRIPEGLTIICHPPNKYILIGAIGNNNLFKIRLYQVVIDISVDTHEALKKVEREGLVEGLCQMLLSDDVLARLALMEELTKLAVTPHGFEFLQKIKMMDLLVQQLESYEKDPLSSLISPGLFKFFGSVGKTYALELFSVYPTILPTLFQAVSSDELPIVITAFETIGFIATSPTGKKLLASQDKREMSEVLRKIEHSMRTLPNEWRVRTVNSIANFIHLEDLVGANDLIHTSQMWFKELGPNALDNIFQMSKQPFPDLKAAAMQVMLELAHHPWGQEKIRDCPGLVDFLLDRSTETALEGMQAKYNILLNIVDSPSGTEVFQETEYWRLKEYIKQGPCFAQRLTEVAFEGQPH